MSTEKKDYFKDAANLAADELKRLIDARIMTEILKSTGWTEVIIENMDESKSKWIARNLKRSIAGKYYGFYDTWVFEKEEDALYFRLKWK